MTINELQMHRLVDPTTSAIIPEFNLSTRLDSLNDKKVGLIDDAKENAKELLEEFASLLNENYGVLHRLVDPTTSAIIRDSTCLLD